jgi:hypothetical protein
LIGHIAANIKKTHKNISLILVIAGLFLIILGTYKLLNPSVKIEWTTESEVDTLGFNLIRVQRSVPDDGQLINPQLILALGSPISGETYHFVDTNVKVGKSYIYHLQETTLSNEIVDLESIIVRVRYQGLIEIVGALVLLSLSFVLARTNQKNIPDK